MGRLKSGFLFRPLNLSPPTAAHIDLEWVQRAQRSAGVTLHLLLDEYASANSKGRSTLIASA